jgi:hypothetical protein
VALRKLRDPLLGLTGKYTLHLVEVTGPNFLIDLLLAIALGSQARRSERGLSARRSDIGARLAVADG